MEENGLDDGIPHTVTFSKKDMRYEGFDLRIAAVDVDVSFGRSAGQMAHPGTLFSSSGP